MNEFPEFMKRPANRIGQESQHTAGIEGYVFTGTDGSQMAFWTCSENRTSQEHTHDFDEYFVVVQGAYTVIIKDKETVYAAGEECHIPKGAPHAGRAAAGTRTIHCFGGKRV